MSEMYSAYEEHKAVNTKLTVHVKPARGVTCKSDAAKGDLRLVAFSPAISLVEVASRPGASSIDLGVVGTHPNGKALHALVAPKIFLPGAAESA